MLRLDIWAAVLETYSLIETGRTFRDPEIGFSKPVQLPAFESLFR